jgi:hypothetical protein
VKQGGHKEEDENILSRQLDIWSKMILKRIWKKWDKVRVEYIHLAYDNSQYGVE